MWAWVGNGISNNMGAIKDITKAPKDPKIIISRSHKGDGEEIVKQAFGGGELVQKIRLFPPSLCSAILFTSSFIFFLYFY